MCCFIHDFWMYLHNCCFGDSLKTFIMVKGQFSKVQFVFAHTHACTHERQVAVVSRVPTSVKTLM